MLVYIMTKSNGPGVPLSMGLTMENKLYLAWNNWSDCMFRVCEKSEMHLGGPDTICSV